MFTDGLQASQIQTKSAGMIETGPIQAKSPTSRSGGTDLVWSPNTLFAAYASFHVLLWTLAPALMFKCVPQDTLEGITWGNMWLFGYDKHPPLAAWLSAFVTDAFGTVGWPVYLASQLCILLCFWAVWKLALEFLEPWRALSAVLLLDGIHYYNLSSFTLNPNIVMLPVWAMLSLTAYHAMRQPSLSRWAIAGVWAGLAVLAKYESAIIFIVLILLLACTQQGRRSLTTPGFYAGLSLAMLIALPNLVWLYQHDFISIHYALGEGEYAVSNHTAKDGRWRDSIVFLAEQLESILPALLIYLFIWRPKPRFVSGDFGQIYVLALAAGLLTVTLVLANLFEAHLVSRWGFPFFSLFGLALMLFFTPDVSPRQIKQLVATLVILQVVMAAALAWMIYERPYHTGKPPFTIDFPAKPLAEHVTEQWHRRFGTRLKFVGGERWRVSGVGAYSADKPMPYFDLDPKTNPWMREADFRREGGVIVYQLHGQPDDADRIDAAKKRFPSLEGEERLALPELSSAPLPPVLFWIGYLPPDSVVSAKPGS